MSKLSLLLASAFVLSGCSNYNAGPSNMAAASYNLDAEVRAATQKLLLKSKIDPELPIITVGFVDVDYLIRSSTLGRALGERFSTALTQSGLNVIDVKPRAAALYDPNNGTIDVTDEFKAVMESHGTKVLLLGTYAVGGNNVYVSARLVEPQSSKVIAAEDLVVPINGDLRQMVEPPVNRFRRI